MQDVTSERGTKPEGSPADVLSVRSLKTYFFTRAGILKAVDDLSFTVRKGETLAVVGESGCGKSMTALSIMRLVPDPPGRIVGGAVELDGRDLLQLEEAAMREVRGKDISMIFQEPMTSLNPVLTIGEQISECWRCTRISRGLQCARRRSRCYVAFAFPSRRNGRGSTRTNSPAACASAP
jgi:ABC-type dipeptide/oligopeptide/nickel transport system ATPase component